MSLSLCGSIPRISDGVVFNVLKNLLILDGERLSYRTLDVEQIGSVYEAIMGFELEVAQERSIAIKATKSHGAPATINLEALLETKPADRAKQLKTWTDQKLGTADANAMKEASSVEELRAAFGKKVAAHVTPYVVPMGAMIFQPSDERRRSGSHYTPRSLTEPIVRTTLEPILKQLVTHPGEENHRDSEAQRKENERDQPSSSLCLRASMVQPRPIDKELRKRLTKGEIAQRELLEQKRADAANAAIEVGTPHPSQLLDLKICDPAMGSGAFLVEVCRQLGLTRRQIIGFHWEPKKQKKFGEDLIQRRLDRATEARAKILNAREDVSYRDQEQRLAVANEALGMIRMISDACVSAFFAGKKKKEREQIVEQLFGTVTDYVASLATRNQQLTTSLRSKLAAAAASLRNGEHPIPPFHWEIEFPEVLSRENSGFDAFVGNPPFVGGARIWPVYQRGRREAPGNMVAIRNGDTSAKQGKGWLRPCHCHRSHQ